MREAALDVLLQLYAAPANLSPLHVFTERFLQRFAELVRGARGSNLLLIDLSSSGNVSKQYFHCH